MCWGLCGLGRREGRLCDKGSKGFLESRGNLPAPHHHHGQLLPGPCRFNAPLGADRGLGGWAASLGGGPSGDLQAPRHLSIHLSIPAPRRDPGATTQSPDSHWIRPRSPNERKTNPKQRPAQPAGRREKEPGHWRGRGWALGRRGAAAGSADLDLGAERGCGADPPALQPPAGPAPATLAAEPAAGECGRGAGGSPAAARDSEGGGWSEGCPGPSAAAHSGKEGQDGAGTQCWLPCPQLVSAAVLPRRPSALCVLEGSSVRAVPPPDVTPFVHPDSWRLLCTTRGDRSRAIPASTGGSLAQCGPLAFSSRHRAVLGAGVVYLLGRLVHKSVGTSVYWGTRPCRACHPHALPLPVRAAGWLVCKGRRCERFWVCCFHQLCVHTRDLAGEHGRGSGRHLELGLRCRA